MNLSSSRLLAATLFAAFATAGAVVPQDAYAGVVINGTRVVYSAAKREVTVRLDNQDKQPALVQVWLDNGDAASTPATTDAPFVMTPPVFRMEPGKQQVLRIMHDGRALPQDHESVFWLNVLEVPPKAKGANVMQFAFRHRIKMFYRPEGLKDSAGAAPAALHWTVVPNDGGYALQVRNPTAYHVSFSKVELVDGAKHYPRKEGALSMVAPGESATIAMKDLAGRPAQPKVAFETINDFGGMHAGEATVDATP